jgi:hypothetical protein
MQWHTVVFNRGDQRVKDTAAQAFMQDFRTRYQEFVGHTAGCLDGVEIHHTQDEGGNHLYHFSPVAASIGAQLLREFGAVACAENPRLEECEMVKNL